MDILKRFIVTLILLLSTFTLYSQDWIEELKLNLVDQKLIHMPALEVDFTRRGFEVETRVFDGEWLQKYTYSISDMTLNKLGFLENKIDDIPHYHVLGNQYMLVFTKDPLSGLCTTMTDIRGVKLKQDPGYLNRLEWYYMDSQSLSPGFRTVASSSFLTETISSLTLEYNGERFSDLFLTSRAGGSHNLYALPWVEGVEGPGIGEWVQVEPTSPKKTFYILNGFVDPYRPHLYKMNSRVKEGLAIGTTSTGKTIEQNVHFEDFAYFKTVVFTEPVATMRLVIQSVYPGSKWQDTAISAILLEREDQ